jgi:hypothetical protein
LIADCKRLCEHLRQTTGIRDATVFRALLAPPGGRGPYVRRRGASIHLARFDVVILIETESVKAAEDLRDDPVYRELDARVRDVARYVYATTATNVKRIGPVDHSRDGVFLFNYFVADRPSQNIAVWHYTAAGFNRKPASTTPPSCCRSDPVNRGTRSSITADGIDCAMSCPRCCSNDHSVATCWRTLRPTIRRRCRFCTR